MSRPRFDAQALIQARRRLTPPPRPSLTQMEAEGGCGVTGFACSIPVAGRHIFAPSFQMHNRGNGKGGGIACVGLDHRSLGVEEKTLKSHYLLQIAFLEPECRADLETRFISPHFEVAQAARLESLDDFRELDGLEVAPPAVWRYFVRVKGEVLDCFVAEQGLAHLARQAAEDEFVYQNTFQLNSAFYESGGRQRAFVLSHGKDMMILKIVGYAEDVVRFYRLEEFKAHIWIAHQRYPTKGRVWHPGGAHPFAGLHEALVHNGDFANYHSVCEYLRQRRIYPLFLTDTEVSVLLFDLLTRTYGYPLEYAIEALAPTSELDWDNLPLDKQALYAAIQRHHLHAAPDGPWFFIIAGHDPYSDVHQLLGITDTAMLRPQVFALQEGEAAVGLICSEKQAIDATLRSLASEDERFSPMADIYWNARGGSHTDGGAFIFTLKPVGDHGRVLVCTDKFGREIHAPTDQSPRPGRVPDLTFGQAAALPADNPVGAILTELDQASYERLDQLVSGLVDLGHRQPWTAIAGLNALIDKRADPGAKRRRGVVETALAGLSGLFDSLPYIEDGGDSLVRIDYASRAALRPPEAGEEALVICSRDFPPEGEDCDARLLVAAYHLGWKSFLVYELRGQRFLGCGLGQETAGVSIDAYGSSGDYLASGIDGLTIIVHGNGQDQLGQIMKSGKLVIHGDVGQTFLYGAKGGEVYVLGNAAGRPMINAVGRPRVVINGTCLDYLAESFMAGDPLNGGGFVVLNGLCLDEHGRPLDLPSPYPGSNLFSLASGGAIYVRDPAGLLIDEQLNGGAFARLSEADWRLIEPYLKENERLFGLAIETLLTVAGVRREPDQVYRKVKPQELSVLGKAGLEEWA